MGPINRSVILTGNPRIWRFKKIMTKELMCDTMTIGGVRAGTSAALRAYEFTEPVWITHGFMKNSVMCRRFGEGANRACSLAPGRQLFIVQ